MVDERAARAAAVVHRVLKMDPTTLLGLVVACAPLIDPITAHALVATESALNPHAIGVVAGSLERQPRTRGEALTTAATLQARGMDFSVGLAQINVRNVRRLGLSLENAFDPCVNLQAMQTVLADCYGRAPASKRAPQRALRQALSCYYSGNFERGFRDGYVQRVLRAATRLPAPSPSHRQEFP